VIGVRFPVPPPRTGQAWVEYGRRYADLPLVGLACGLTLDAGGAIEGATLVCSGVGEKPWRVPVADLLAGAVPEAFEEVARAAAAQCAPAGDARTDASHRRRLVYALILRALQSAWNRAGERA
jgi:carbon-monoxide dehydrogenase medium subunit